MNTHEIELPPLPPGYKSYEFPDGGYDEDEMRAYARAAIEADRKRTADLLKNPIHVHVNMCRGIIAPITFDQLAHVLGDEATEAWLADHKRRGEPVAYGVIASNTGRISTLVLPRDFESVGLDQMLPEHVVPLYDAPQPTEPDYKALYFSEQKRRIEAEAHADMSCGFEPQPAEPDEERLAMEAVMESVDPATWPGLTLAQRCALGRFAKPQPAEPVKRKRPYAQGTALGEYGVIPMCDQAAEPVKMPSDTQESK